MWIIVSVTIRLSSPSLKRQASTETLGSTHGATSSKLHHWEQESSMFRLKAKNSRWHLLASFEVNCMPLRSLELKKKKIWGDTSLFFFASFSCLVQKYSAQDDSVCWCMLRSIHDESWGREAFVVTSSCSVAHANRLCRNAERRRVQTPGLICFQSELVWETVM